MSGHIEGVPALPAGIRNPEADRRKAIEDKIELHRSLGETPPDFLLGLLAGYEGDLEHAAQQGAPEKAVPAGPTKPRKPSDADRATRRD